MTDIETAKKNIKDVLLKGIKAADVQAHAYFQKLPADAREELKDFYLELFEKVFGNAKILWAESQTVPWDQVIIEATPYQSQMIETLLTLLDQQKKILDTLKGGQDAGAIAAQQKKVTDMADAIKKLQAGLTESVSKDWLRVNQIEIDMAEEARTLSVQVSEKGAKSVQKRIDSLMKEKAKLMKKLEATGEANPSTNPGYMTDPLDTGERSFRTDLKSYLAK
jgi:hypothetical protein